MLQGLGVASIVFTTVLEIFHLVMVRRQHRQTLPLASAFQDAEAATHPGPANAASESSLVVSAYSEDFAAAQSPEDRCL
jgi:hypothetical protein